MCKTKEVPLCPQVGTSLKGWVASTCGWVDAERGRVNFEGLGWVWGV